jgi:hypothetical protein
LPCQQRRQRLDADGQIAEAEDVVDLQRDRGKGDADGQIAEKDDRDERRDA